jgi:hypothetical protein
MTKPLFEVTKRPSADRSAKAGKHSQIITTAEPHSQHGWERSEKYHKMVGTHGRAVEELNPTDVVPAHRSYPGLAN